MSAKIDENNLKNNENNIVNQLNDCRRKCCGQFSCFEACLVWIALILFAALLGTVVSWVVLTKGFREPWPGNYCKIKVSNNYIKIRGEGGRNG